MNIKITKKEEGGHEIKVSLAIHYPGTINLGEHLTLSQELDVLKRIRSQVDNRIKSVQGNLTAYELKNSNQTDLLDQIKKEEDGK